MVGNTEKSIWQSNLLLAVFSLSVANLNLLPVWRILIFASDPDLYFVPTIRRHDYIGALLLMLILAGGVFLFVKVAAWRDSDANKWVVLGLIVVCLINPLNFLRIALPNSVIRELKASLPYLGVGIAMASVLFWKWRRGAARALFLLLVTLCPFALTNSAQAVWRAVFIVDEKGTTGESRRPAEPAGGKDPDDLQRLIWILFDELDQRILFEQRPAGYEFPAFDSFRKQSIYASRFVPPGGHTMTAMPTYWIGQRVVDSRNRFRQRLEVQIEGRDDFVSVSDCDNLFAEAFASGASTGITGFYHPYCHLFGKFFDHCDGFLGDLWHSPSENLLSSIKGSARSLIPGWRRGGAIRTFKSIRSAALELTVDPERDFVVVHVNMPHDPPICDPRSDGFKISGLGLSYADNLTCADKMLGEIERDARKAGLWNGTAVVIMSDHGWKKLRPGWDSEPGAIPLMIKMADQSEEIQVDQELDSVLTKRLLLGILRRELRTPRDVVSWVRSQ